MIAENNKPKVKDVKKVMQYLEDLDLGVGFTEREWIDLLDQMDDDEKVTFKKINKMIED